MTQNREQHRHEQQETFLAAYAETRDISQAFITSGVSRSTHYGWMNRYPEYKQRFDEIGVLRPGIPKGYKYETGWRAERKRQHQDEFLTALAKTGLVTEASRECGSGYGSHFSWMKTDEWYRERAEAILTETAEKRRDAITRSRTRASSNASADTRQAITDGLKRHWEEDRVSDEITQGKRLTRYEYAIATWLHENNIVYHAQFTIPGRIADFLIPALMLNIEVDARDHNKPAAVKKDRECDESLIAAGYIIYRIPHHAIDDNSYVPVLRHALGINPQ